MRRFALVSLLVVVATSCTSQQKLKTALADAERASAEKDSLLGEVLATAQLVTDINSELAKVRDLGVAPVVAGERPAKASEQERQAVLGKIREVIARLNATEAQLEQSRTRIAGLQRKDAKLLAQLEQYEKTIADLKTAAEQQQAILEQQQAEIAQLGERLDTATAENARLSQRTEDLSNEVSALTEEVQTAYVAIGTEQELIEKGVLVKEGSKFLFFGGRKTMPARDLSPAQFTPLNIARDTVIALPASEKGWRIVSRHNVNLVTSPAEKDGRYLDRLQIRSPLRFWENSKFLILVEG